MIFFLISLVSKTKLPVKQLWLQERHLVRVSPRGGGVISSAARRKRSADSVTEVDSTEVTDEEIVEEMTPLVKEGDAEFERLLAEEEAIEASTREHTETPHFRSGDGD